MNSFVFSLSLFIALIFSCASAHSMYIDKAIIDFLPDDVPRQDVKVTNDSDDNLYVQVEVLEVTNPGTDKEQRTPVTNPDEISLLVTPSKMAIPPNGSKTVRILNLDETLQEEKVYRINVTPIMPPLQEEGEKSMVRVVIAYQILVLVAPNQPKYVLNSVRNGKDLSFSNSGNSYVVITEGEQCVEPSKDSEAKDDALCFAIPSKRLYPGNSYHVSLPHDAPAMVSLKGVAGNETVKTP